MEYLHDDSRGMSVNDQMVLELWKEGISMDMGHYQLPIPFRDENLQLPENLFLAERRLESLRKKLKRDDYLLSKYKEGMSSLLEKGYAEKVDTTVRAQTEEKQNVWYLPHHPVVNPKKPGKVRIVYDCAAKSNQVSLNDVVHQGPDLTNKLTGVLLRFRKDPIALTADIEAMFHQVRVPPSERDVLRFLWWPSGDMSVEPHVYRMCVHLFGGTWSPSACSFALRQTAIDNQQDFGPETIETVLQHFYVDDCLVSTETEERAIKLAVELRELLSRGGFNLTKWMSNSPAVVESIPVDERAKELCGVDLNYDALPIDRALGITWNVETDCFGYKILPKCKPFTRRGLLSVVSSTYDPLGFASPFLVRGKLILQELCRKELAWDDPIPVVDKEKWLIWLNELADIEQFTVNRCIRPHGFADPVKYDLHHFSDASEGAYGAASYLISKTGNNQMHSELLMAKSHLAPIKKSTIPRLELSAAAISVKLDAFLRRELNVPVDSSHFWTDSTIVLGYIGNKEKRFRTFVANRVAAIRSYSNPEQWHFVDSKSNPADDVSRGLSAKDLLASERWVHGPDFLVQGKENWPTSPIEAGNLLDNDPEVKLVKDASTFGTAVDER
ncbi:uncharacterized protein LOC121421892 [Lytechinus variegatus]|uniref:uncharacterized protein LOC121421892 n=1 Tax=Lytechinus variegatus TaxID=7654 RepID=UPI001BB2A101|nr:uncharacterized protein LOC121421892 [Lytechinus variegatus]